MEDILDQEAKRLSSFYKESFDFLDAKKNMQVQNLKLFNNLDKADDVVSSSLFISSFQKILGVLYSDILQHKFMPTDGSDYQTVERLNSFFEYEYNWMKQQNLWKYDAVWDSLFFNMGIVDMNGWGKNHVMPETINPLYFGYDPYFSDEKKWRYYWKWITFPKHQMKKLEKSGKLLVSLDEIPSGFEENVWRYKSDIDQSKGANGISPDASNDNSVYQLLDMYAFDEDGKRVRYWLDKGVSKIVAKDEKIPQDYWNLVIYRSMRIPHSSIGISKADIIEDKHRDFGVILNLLNIKAKDYATPIYEYEADLVKDKSALLQRQVNQHIPVDKIGVIQPLNKDMPLDNSMIAFIELIKNEVYDGIGLASAAMTKKKMSATEMAARQQLADTVSSIDANLISNSEMNFCDLWYKNMDKKLKKSGTVSMPIDRGTGDVIIENYTKEQIIAQQPVSISIVSSQEKQYKDLVDRRDLMQIYPAIAQAIGDKQDQRNFIKYVLIPKFINNEKQINIAFPKTVDEVKASQENEILAKNETTPIDQSDDDKVHMAIHLTGKKTAATFAHYFAHELQYGQKLKQKQEQASQGGQETQTPNDGGDGSKPQLLKTAGGRRTIPKDKKNPMETATPLKAEIGKDIFKSNKM